MALSFPPARPNPSPTARRVNGRHTGVALAVALLLLPIGVAQPLHAAEVTDPSDQRKAEAIATEAKLLFQQKAYAQAAERFMEAYTIVRRPALIFNAARAYEEGGQLRKAAALFRAYRDHADTPADGKADADARIVRLEAEMKAREPKPEPAKLPDAPKALPEAVTPTVVVPKLEPKLPKPIVIVPVPRPAPVWPLAPTVTAGALLLASGIMQGVALSEAGSARDMEANLNTPAQRDEYLGHASKAKTYQGMAIAGAVLTAGSLGWLVWDLWSQGRKTRAAAWRIQPSVAPGAAGLAWSGRY